MEVSESNQVNPFLRWTGSKRWLIKDYINDFLPTQFTNYHEPFLGGGAVFFYLKSINYNQEHNYYLSDSNEELINCYIQLRDNIAAVLKHLRNFKNSEIEYYKIRNLSPKSDCKRAARFIYLNRTSFNGIYRVNSQGCYNVPYGHREKVDFVTSEQLNDINNFLQGIVLKHTSFENNISSIHENDLVFIDPPYTVAHENNGFIEYNQRLFSWEDQLKLKEFIREIINRKAYFILTNASHSSIYDLYQDIGSIVKLSRASQVGGRNKTRGIYNELIVCNTKKSYGK
ncbi:Dam family site-specific DNA-(adenine-N6)-methyltransferase [Chitinophaga ginsengisegetis]